MTIKDVTEQDNDDQNLKLADLIASDFKRSTISQELETILDDVWLKEHLSLDETNQLLSQAKEHINSELNELKYKIVESNTLNKLTSDTEELVHFILGKSHKFNDLNTKWFIRLQYILGVLYSRAGERAIGFEHFEKMWQAAVDKKDFHNQALALHEMANYLDKEEYYQEAKNIWQGTGYKIGVIACLRNDGCRRLKQDPLVLEDMEKVIQMGKEAVEIAEEADSFYWLGLSYQIIAEAHAHLDNYQKCLEHVVLFKQAFEKAGLKDSSNRLTLEARIYNVLKEHETVVRLAQEALCFENDAGGTLELYEILAPSYAALGDFEQAYHYQCKKTMVKDKLYNEENIRKKRFLEVIHETDLAKHKASLEEEKSQFLQTYVKKLEGLNAEIKEISLRDSLTTLFNRRHLMNELEKLTTTSRKYNHDFSLALLDADHFKQVNDSFGHTIGDEVLIAIAQLLKDECREDDVVARYGGEEFIILFPLTSINKAISICERIRQKIESYPWEDITKDLKVTVSIGASQYTPSMSIEDILNASDEKLYQAKENGRNCVFA